MRSYNFKINYIPVRVTWTAETVMLDAGQDGSMRRVIQKYPRKEYGITRMSRNIAHGLAMAASAEWHRMDNGGEW